MEYGIEIMLQEFDQNFERAIAYCQRQVWMAGINGNARFEREYGELTSQLIALRTSRIKESKRDQYELRLQKTDIS